MANEESREWRHTLERAAEGDDGFAEDAARALETEILTTPPYRCDVKSAFVETPDGRLIDKDDLRGYLKPPAVDPQ
jgi:hypothetical protein